MCSGCACCKTRQRARCATFHRSRAQACRASWSICLAWQMGCTSKMSLCRGETRVLCPPAAPGSMLGTTLCPLGTFQHPSLLVNPDFCLVHCPRPALPALLCLSLTPQISHWKSESSANTKEVHTIDKRRGACCSDVSKGLEAGGRQGKDVHCVTATNEVSIICVVCTTWCGGLCFCAVFSHKHEQGVECEEFWGGKGMLQ
jgi:hypothetical protein